MKIPMYFDYVQNGSSPEKLNSVSLQASQLYCKRKTMINIFNFPKFNDEIELIKEDYGGEFYYPIFWAYDDEYFEEISIPNFVLNQIEKQKAKILIVNIYEGYSIADEVDTYIVKKFNIDINNVVILNGNKYKSKNIQSVYFNFWETFIKFQPINSSELYHKSYNLIFSKNNRRLNKFICLQRRPKPQRMALYTELYPYRNQGILTMGRGDYGSKRYETFYKNERELFGGLFPSSYKKFKKNKLINTLPAEYDINVSLHNMAFDKNIEKFYSAYLHIVSETWFNNRSETIFFSEKIFKPVVYFQPFVLFNHHRSLAEFKLLGYETFSEFIDESYDFIEDDNKRFYSAVESVFKFIKQNDKTLSNIMKKSFPIMAHNFFNLSSTFNTTVVRVKSKLLTYLYNI